jgi:paraquat-inducible protein B
MFLLQKPELSINGAKNLKNIIFGNYISISPKEGKLTKNTFKVYQNQINDSNSFKLTLYTDKLNSITLNSNIYYRNIPIGKVLNYSLTNDLKHIKITIAIQKKYKNLINNNSMFYDISSKLIALKNLNLNVNYEGINPLINGGIAVVTTPNKKLTKKSFKLYHSYQDIAEIKKLKHKGFVTNAYFSNDIKVSKNMNIEYKNQIIGFVRNIYFKTPDYSIAQLFIYEKYKPLITPHTIFYKKNPINIKANLNGINISIDNLTSLIKGSITLINTQQRYKKLQIAKNIDEINQKNSIKIVFSNGDGITTGSKLIYKGVKVGKVTKVELQNKKVIVYAILYNKNFTKKGTIFYLKKPIVSIDEVKNISSLILPVNIGIIKGNGKYTNYFVGYDKKPLQFNSDKGMIFKVYSTTASQNINAPVYYKNVKIGKIVNIDLTNKADKVLLYVFIQKKYTKLIRTNTKFYDISGLSIKFSFLKGTQIKANTLESIMRGGILVVTPINYSKKATTKDTFVLYQKPPKDWQKISPKIP